MSYIKIDPSTSCWTWTGAHDGIGRPLTYNKGVPVRVQHLYFQQKHGYKARRIGTTCENKLCVNPEHLCDATRGIAQERIKRMIATTNIDEETRRALEQ